MLKTRKAGSILGWGTLEWHDGGNDRIAAFHRRQGSQEILAVHNLSDSRERVSVPRSAALKDLLTGQRFDTEALVDGIELAPYQYLWLTSDGGLSASS
jgi:glycosidase